MITIRLKTGQVLTFPDGTSDAVIQASIRRVQSGELDQKPVPAAKSPTPASAPSPSLQIGVPRLAQNLARSAPAIQLANPPTPKPNPTAVPKPPERTPAFWRSVTGSDDPKDWAAYDRDATLQRAEAGGAASMAKLGFLDRETYYENPETGERYLKRHKSGKLPPPLDPEYRPRTAMDRLHEAYAAEGRDFPTPEDRAVDREFARGLPERVAGSMAGATSLPLRAAEAVGTGVREEIRQFDEDLRHGHRVSTGAGFTRGASIGWEKSPAGRASDAFNRDVVEPSRDRLIEAALRAGHSPEAAAMADTGQALVAETLNPANYIGPEELIGGVRGVRALSAPAVRAAELEAQGGSRVLEDATGLVTREYGSGSAASEIAQRRLARELAVPDEPLIYREGPDGPPRGAVGWKGQIPDTLRDITGRPWREYDPAGTGDGILLARPESPAPRPRNVERAPLEVALTGGDDASREHIAGLWDYASRRYPRIASEVREVRIDPNGAAYFDSGSGVLALPADADLGSMMHELTHVAQNARGQLVEGAESAYEPYAVRAGEVYGRVQQPQRTAIAKLDDPDARLMRALEAEFPDIRDEDYLRRRGSGVSTILDSDADYVGPGAVYGAFRPESEIEQIGSFGSRQDQDVALGMRAASKESADELLRRSLDIGTYIQDEGVIGSPRPAGSGIEILPSEVTAADQRLGLLRPEDVAPSDYAVRRTGTGIEVVEPGGRVRTFRGETAERDASIWLDQENERLLSTEMHDDRVFRDHRLDQQIADRASAIDYLVSDSEARYRQELAKRREAAGAIEAETGRPATRAEVDARIGSQPRQLVFSDEAKRDRFAAPMTGLSVAGNGHLMMNFDTTVGKPVSESYVRSLLPDLPEGWSYSVYTKTNSMRPDLQNWHVDIFNEKGRVVGDGPTQEILGRMGGYQRAAHRGGMDGWFNSVTDNLAHETGFSVVNEARITEPIRPLDSASPFYEGRGPRMLRSVANDIDSPTPPTRAFARDIRTGKPSRTRIRVMADPEAEAKRQQDLAYMRSKARPNLPGIDETETARRQFLSDRFKALGYELSDEDFSSPITIGPEDYADGTPGSSAFTSNYYPEHVFFIDDPNRGWTYRHPEFEHARMAAHETYHTTGKFGDDGVSIGFRVPELTARARELGVPNISALEEGMATRAETSAVRGYLAERFPESMQARQEMIDVVRNHGMYPNVPDSALVFIEPRKDWADAGWPFEVFARYEGPMQLVDHLVDTVPDFERLAERFRLFRDAGPLRRAVDRVYGKGTTDELLRTPEAEAGNMLQRLAAKKPVRAYAQMPKPRTPDEIAAEGMGWRLPDGPPSAVGPSLQLPDFQTNLAAQLGNDPQIADYLIQESDAVFKKIGPPQSWDTLEEMASRLGASKEQLLSDTPHWAVLSPEARLRLLYVIKGNEQKIGDLQAKLAAGAASDTEKADLLRLIETRGDLLKLGAKTGSAYGRALNSLRMEARLALSDSQIMRQQLYQKYAKQLDAEKPLMDALAKLDPGNQDELQSFLRQVDRPTFRQYLQEFWVASILSSPASHERNLIGNSINMLIENAVVRPTSALFDAARVAGTGQPREIFARETAAAVVGLGHGFRTGLRRGLEVIKRGYDPDTMTGKLFPVRSAFARSQNKVVRDIVGPFVTMPLRLLSASDAVAKTVNWTAEIYAQAARAAAREGLSGSGFAKRVAELVANPTDDMISAADNFALRATFNDETSAVGKAISNLRDIPNASSQNPALQTGIEAYRTGMGFMLPFIHIADRLMVRGLEYSPLSAVTAIGARRAGNYAEAADLAARASIGSLVMAYAASLAMEGRITGAAPSDEGERAAFYGANKQPWSVRTEGGVWVPYGQLQPVGTPFALAAAAYKGWSEHGEAPDTEKLGHAAAQIGSYVSDQSYLSSLGKLMDVISGSETDAGRAFADVAANTVWGLMPYSGLTRSIAKGIDPRVIDAKTIGERLEQNMPVASLGMNAKLDPWGEEVVPTGGRLRTILASGTVMLPSREKSRYPVSKVYRHDAAAVTGRGTVETDYNTPLQPEEQAAYTAWKAQYAPNDYGVDYDYPGAFKAGVAPDPVNGHWPDTFKKPNHPTFSEESIYAQDAPGLAGHWEGDQFVPPPELGLDEELARLGMPLGYVGRTISSKRDGGTIKLTPDEHYIYQQAAGRASKLILQNLFTKEGWADLDIEAQRDEVTKAIGQARRFARFVVLRYHRKEGAPGMNPDIGYVGSVLASEDN